MCTTSSSIKSVNIMRLLIISETCSNFMNYGRRTMRLLELFWISVVSPMVMIASYTDQHYCKSHYCQLNVL